MDPYEDRGYKVILATAFGFAIATTAVVLRLSSRWLCRKTLELNDYLLFLAYIPKLGIDIASILLLEYGIGKHIQMLSLDMVTRYLQVLYVGSFLYVPTIALTKLSILSLFWAAFPSKYMRISVFVLGGIVTSWGVACLIVGLLPCLPIRKAWTPEISGTCINMNHYYFGLQIPNIVTDIAIFFLPFKAVWELQLPTKQKYLMSGIFCIALVTCAFDVVRLVVLLQLPDNIDLTWNQVAGSIWTDIEPSMALLVASLPVCRPLLQPRRFWQLRKMSNANSDHEETPEESVGPKAGYSSGESNEIRSSWRMEEGR